MTQLATPIRRIAVVVVNYRTADLALEAVASVLAQDHGGREVTVHLIDNASPGGDADRLAAAIDKRGWSDRIIFYPERENHGFGRGNNIVIRALEARDNPPDAVFLLNPDARLDGEAVDTLAAFLEAHPRAGCAGARVTKPDARGSTAAFRFPSLASEFSDSLAFGPVARMFAGYTVPLPPELSTSRVDWVVGAAAMFRWSALAEVGGFDPDYFLYFEEVDLMRRLTRRGWQVWHVAEARVVHAEGASTGVRSGEERRTPLPDYWYDSWYLYFSKSHGPVYARLCAVARATGWSLNRLISTLRGSTSNAPPRWSDGFYRRVVRPMIGRKAG
jgi:hypothetical protein